MTTTAKLKQTWQGYARGLLQDALLERNMTYRQLSELLQQTYGMAIAWKVLGRKIGRGTFDAGFFFAVMAALKVHHIDMAGAPGCGGTLDFAPGQDRKQQTWIPN